SRPGVATSDILTASVIADVEKVIAAELPELPEDVSITPGLPPAAPAPRPSRPPAAPPSRTPDGLPPRSTAVNPTLRPRMATATRLAPTLMARPASIDLTALRVGLTRLAAAEEAGVTTRARSDTELKLGEAEVMDVAQDYGDPRLGEGLARLRGALGDEWPATKDAVWLGESGRALSVDLAFRKLPEESVHDFAALVKAAADKQEADEIDSLLGKVD